MWIVGHTALAYLVVRSGFFIAGKRPGPALIFMVLVFGNILDATHFGWLRDVTHNPAGPVLFTLLWALIFQRFGLVGKKDLGILMSAGAVHAAGDLVIGGYLPFFPFSGRAYYVWPWNSLEDLLLETILGAIFLAVLFLSRDYRGLVDFAADQRRDFLAAIRTRSLFRRELLHAYIFIAFYLLMVGQFVFYVRTRTGHLLDADVYSWLFLAVFALFMAAISQIAFGKGACRKTDD